jgi:integrase/recombinase XerD
MKIEMDTKKKSFEGGFEEFLRHCSVSGYAESTLENYRTSVAQFNRFYQADKPLNEITSDTIEDYVYYLRQNTGLSNVSLAIRLKNLKALCNYFYRKGYMNPIEFPQLRCEKKVKETYTDEELKLLLVKPKVKICKFTEYRNWVIINYLLSTGNRRGTLVNVKISDVDFESSVIKLEKTKNKKQQYIPLSVTLSNILREYIKHRDGNMNDYLFCDAYGRQLDIQNLRPSLNRYHKDRGVKKTSIHLYRHTSPLKKWNIGRRDLVFFFPPAWQKKIFGAFPVPPLTVVKEYVREVFFLEMTWQQDFFFFDNFLNAL